MPHNEITLQKQMQMEQEAYDKALNKYNNEILAKIERGTIGDSREAIILIKATVDTLSNYLKEYYKTPLRGNQRKVQLILKNNFDRPDDLAYIAIKIAVSVVLERREDEKVAITSRKITKLLKEVIRATALQQQYPSMFNKLEQDFRTRSKGFVNSKKIKVATKIGLGALSHDLAILVGSTLVDLINKSGCNLLKLSKIGSTTYISLSDEAKALFLKSQEIFSSFMISYKPLIYEPKDWVGIKGTGGYYTYDNIDFIKLKNKRDLKLVRQNKADLSRLYGVINGLQKVPYRVNKRVLKTIEYIINHNLVNPQSNVYNPVLYGDIPYMETMDLYKLIPKHTYGQLDDNNRFINHDDKVSWARALDLQSKKIEGITSKRLQYSLALNVAKEYKDYDKFYFTYQTDFRGRLYPVQSYLNPQTSDNIKPLLEFSEGCKLSPDGLYWLKIHGANCYGFDKLTYEERIKEIDEREDEIKAIWQDPIGNIRYWYEADCPLMYLAFAFSYGDYLNDPETPCHSPVYLDATCSGIQIYSGLLKDKEGAIAVNVVNNDSGRPSDIYQDVANKVEELLEAGEYPSKYSYTTKTGVAHTIGTSIEANSIKGKITRKLTKRNVMTTPYSVTRKGMFDQVLELLDEYEDNNKAFWKGDKWVAAKLISDLNYKAIGLVVKGAIIGQQVIKDTLSEALVTKSHVEWNTPIFNFPVVQRIKKEKKRQLRSPLGSLVIYELTKDTHKQKMLNGIAPNYIHSLDATLLYRTVEMCQEAGKTEFMLIHDSFGMLPNSIPFMNYAVREAYIEIFGNNPLEAWVEQVEPEMLERAKEAMVNNLNVEEEVIDSKYIFS